MFFYLIIFFLPFVQAANDWSIPCFGGVCSYDLPASANATGSMQLSGLPHSISDITSAADWVILDCNSDALAQSIRLVCQSDEPTTGCSHLFNNTGPVGKLVRLPENCGKGPFARVAGAKMSEDQSIPSSIAAKLVRRSGVQPQVHAIDIDSNFSAVDSSTMGVVSLSILGSTVPGANVAMTPSLSRRRSRFSNRDLFGSIIDGISKISNIDVNKTVDLPPINLNNDFPLLSQDISCADKDLSVKADVDVATNAVVSIGIAASGTIIPPKLSDFSLFAGLSGTVNGTLNLNSNAAGSIQTDPITLFEVGIPGLDIPGILTLGPSFKVNAQATATLDVDVDLQVGLSYNVNNAKLFFPPSSDLQSGGDFAPGDTPLAISVSPSVKSTGTITAHLIPTIELGVDALGGVASATVFLDLDASASLELSLDAATSLITTIDSGTSSTTSSSADVTTTSSVSDNSYSASASSPAVAKRDTWHRRAHRRAHSGVAKAKRADVVPVTVEGCVDIGTAFDVNAGAQGSFFDIFNDSTQVTLFSKKFDLFHKCFGGSVNARRAAYHPLQLRSPALSKRFALTCPGTDVNDAVSIIDDLVNAANIIAV